MLSNTSINIRSHVSDLHQAACSSIAAVGSASQHPWQDDRPPVALIHGLHVTASGSTWGPIPWTTAAASR